MTLQSPFLQDDLGWCGDPRRGASMGRRGRNEPGGDSKFTLRRVPVDSGGYDRGGAYWGIGSPLYWYSNQAGTQEGYFRLDRSLIKRNEAACSAYWDNPGITKKEFLKAFPNGGLYVDYIFTSDRLRDRLIAKAQLRGMFPNATFSR
jgi:hypothetical protein